MYVVCPLDIALVFKSDLLCNPYSKHSCYWQVNDAWHPPLFKGHEEFPRDPQPPNLRITEHSTNKFLPRKGGCVTRKWGGIGSNSQKSQWLYYLGHWGTSSLRGTNEGKVMWEGELRSPTVDFTGCNTGKFADDIYCNSSFWSSQSPAISSTALKLYMTCFLLFTTLF